MAGIVHGHANVGDAIGDAGGSFVVNDSDSADRVLTVLDQPRFQLAGIDPVAPIAGYELHIQVESLRHGLPQGGELPGLIHQHLVCGRERIDEARLPGAGARRGEDCNRIRRLEDRPASLQDLSREPGELGAAMVNRGPRDGAENAVRNIGGTGICRKCRPGRCFTIAS